MLDQLWEVEFVIMFQNLGDWLEPIMVAASRLGFPLIYLVMVILYWCIDSRLGRRFSIFLLFTGALGAVLQAAFGVPRPFWVDSRIRQIGSNSTSFGMPSGHALSSFAWLFLAHAVKKWWMWVLMSIIVLLIGMSRIFLGVHFLSQVLVGWLLSLICFVMFIKFEEAVTQWMDFRTSRAQLLLVTAAMFAFISAGWATVGMIDNNMIPELWISNVTPYLGEGETFNPSSFARILGDAGAFFGCVYGILLIAQHGGFDASGSLQARLGRLGLGIVLASIVLTSLFYLESALGFDQASEQVRQWWVFASNFIITLAFYYLIPTIFQRVNLAANPAEYQSVLTGSSSAD